MFLPLVTSQLIYRTKLTGVFMMGILITFSSSEAVVWRCSVKQVFPCEFCEISKNTFFYRTLPVAAAASSCEQLKNNHREKTFPNKTQALTKGMNMDIWVFSTLNQLFKRDSSDQIKFSKKSSSYW